MTEAEWLECVDPRAIARFIGSKVKHDRFQWVGLHWIGQLETLMESYDQPWFDAYVRWVNGTGLPPSEVCNEPVWHPLDNPARAVTCVRSCADAIRRNDTLRIAVYASEAAAEHFALWPNTKFDPAHSHRKRSRKVKEAEAAQAEIHRKAWWAAKAEHKLRVSRECCNQLRDVAGNPFRPVTFLPEWRTETAVAVAQTMYDAREFGNLPILADALQDAGCENADVLDHCRGPGPHVRGCWVVDLVLGKN